MTIVLFDDTSSETLLPLTFTRPVSEIRIGILTIAEKWKKYLDAEVSYKTKSYLKEKFPLRLSADNLFINGSICPDEPLLDAIAKLKEGQAIVQNGLLIAGRLASSDALSGNIFEKLEYVNKFVRICFPEDIFKFNDVEIRKDFTLITKGRISSEISSTNVILGENFFAEDGAEAECSTFNSKDGPVYLGKDTQVWEGSHIRGSFALCDHSQVKMGSKIYGMTTIGPHCRVGGEINNSVLQAYSSKGHDGFLGNSVLGEWCNIGADSNNSNMKNNYAEVRLWDYPTEGFRKTGLQFCGLIMADHAKCAINTMFNTGTVVGVGANIFGSGFPRNFVPDFSWGGNSGFEVHPLKMMFETAKRVYERRNTDFNDTESAILSRVFEMTQQYRRF